MVEETIQKKTGAERQAAFLVTALERASQQNGVLLNGTKKQTPRFFDKGLRVNPVNALIMAIHSDMGGFKTNSYVLFNDTKNRGEAVRKGEKGVPKIQAAALLSPDKGTFRIGIRLSDYVEGHSVRVRWFAYKPTRDTAQFRSRDNVVIKITPDIQKLRPLERVRFTAEVDGTEDKSVTWSVSDPEGGSIDDNGLYQAPSEEGTYEVIARSNADGETRTSAFVLVGE